MPHYPEIERLSCASFAFYDPIRNRRGYDDAAFQELCDAIRACTERWSGEENVPKALAWFLANHAFNVVIHARVSEWYTAEEADRIYKAASTICDLVNRCFVPPGDVDREYIRPALTGRKYDERRRS